MKFMIVILTIFAIFYQIQADNLNNTILGESSTVNPIHDAPLGECQERICSRIYRPLCVAIDGEQTTLASRCHLAKFRCETMKRAAKSSSTTVPIFRVLHEGRCYEMTKRRQNSKNHRTIEDLKYRVPY